MSDLLVKLNALINNKQFWLALIALVVIFVKTLLPTLPVSDEDISKLFFLAVALIFGISFTDVAIAMKEQTSSMKAMYMSKK